MANNNSFKMPLQATAELLGSFARTEEGIKKFTKDMETDINIVQNTDAEVALALPYYSKMEDIPSAATLSEEDLGNASGGFIAGGWELVTMSDEERESLRGVSLASLK